VTFLEYINCGKLLSLSEAEKQMNEMPIKDDQMDTEGKEEEPRFYLPIALQDYVLGVADLTGFTPHI
jgi:hypothetical protein